MLRKRKAYTREMLLIEHSLFQKTLKMLYGLIGQRVLLTFLCKHYQQTRVVTLLRKYRQ
jgi:hypothetical protein